VGKQYAPSAAFAVQRNKGPPELIGNMTRESEPTALNYKVEIVRGSTQNEIADGAPYQVDRHTPFCGEAENAIDQWVAC
jgi:hypothetical protein